ncbi:MAG: hypothetical protein NTY13_02000 [Chlamydiae bacterium]|nr:hypothetical protein [Chlamydiota bacterium]
MLKLIETRDSLCSQDIMEKDARLIGSADTLLHLYTWPQPTLSYGCLVKPEDFLYMEKLGDLSLAKRPTGGGLIFHLSDLAFSFLMPYSSPYFSLNTEDNYLFVNGIVANALGRYIPSYSFFKEETSSLSRFCMAKATKYDILVEGGKLVGAAQRRTKTGLLHQGSISLCPPPRELLERSLREPLYTEMQKTSRYLFSNILSPKELLEKRFEIEQELHRAFYTAIL